MKVRILSARSVLARLLEAIAIAITLLGVMSSPSQAAGLPVVISATVDYTHNTVTITGLNFGSSPAVTLDALTFPTQGTTGTTQIVANFPSGKAPASFMPGTYFLTVTFKNQLPTIFGVDIGANGAQGPAGPAGVTGAAGAPGAQGATGPAGPAGPQGLVGPMGPPGGTGAIGAQGLQGVAGPQGPQGLQGADGPTGETGPQGPAGMVTNFTGCAATIDVAVVYQGAWTCRSSLPHYIDNGDGTVTDSKTGLMWEKKTSACAGEVTCVNDTYSWSTGDNNPDGTMFTTFLSAMNGEASFAGAFNCFADYCDWRIPTINELRSIVSAGFPNCASSVCIDPIFGPTTNNGYWASTTSPTDPSLAWNIAFNDGRVINRGIKVNMSFVRAVRSGR